MVENLMEKQVDYGIITIREDEFRACLEVFPDGEEITLKRHYRLTYLEGDQGVISEVAIVRCSEQGTGEAQNVARDLIDDLDPKWILIVGIGGGVPGGEFSLGDVVLSSEVKDLCLEAKENGGTEYAVKGFRTHREVKNLITHLPAYEKKIDGWSRSLGLPPKVSYKKSHFYGDHQWSEKVRECLKGKFNAGGKACRNPKVVSGPIVSSDRLVKDVEILKEWKKFIRDIDAIEMEAVGAYRAAERTDKQYPTLAIRGISDIVGFKRDPLWTQYACDVAAAFTKKLIYLNPLNKEPSKIAKLEPERVVKKEIKKTKQNRGLFEINDFNCEEYLSLNLNKKFVFVFNSIVNLISLSLSIFIVSVIRYHEKEIIENNERLLKKIKPIKRILSENYTKPSFINVSTLADRCFHLIRADSSAKLIKMKDCLVDPFLLDDVGQMLDELNRLMPYKGGSRYVESAKFNKGLMKFVIPELKKYTNLKKLTSVLAESDLKESALETWIGAYHLIKLNLNAIHDNTYHSRSVDKIDKLNDEYTLINKKYHNGLIELIEEVVPSLEVGEYHNFLSMIELEENILFHLFPFVLIKDNALYYYKRTLASGYEYHSLAEGKVFVKETKKKFNHNVFKTGSSQSLFWTEVPPTINSLNGVRANIPDEGLTNEFVGRIIEKRIIFEQIIEIPNQNGIIYGPGGIGKTALTLQLTEELYAEENLEKVYYNNIIWVSAKSDFYDHIFNTIEPKHPQYKSLSNIFTAILSFFEFDGLDEYDFEDKKELVLEVLEQNKVLLILDNFESISKVETEKIIKFFEIEVKKHLRRLPEYFKVIITSRIQIPSGFHQIELKGLGVKETSDLVDSLFFNYQTFKPELTNSQKKKLHEATKGIPVVVKHCFAKIFEYNQSVGNTISKLPQLSNAIVQFSYKEILSHLSKQTDNPHHINILILLEIVNQPLLTKQMSDILEVDIERIEESVPVLVSYQCLKWIVSRNHEQYIINDEIRILTKSLIHEDIDKTNRVREKVKQNFNVNNDIPSTVEEASIIGIFNSYLSDKSIVDADNFIKEQLKKNHDSATIKYHYAKFLLENQNEPDLAIKHLEELVHYNISSIFLLLVKSYLTLEIPNFIKADKYVCQLEKNHLCDDAAYTLMVDFYTTWSSSVKNQQKFDRIEEQSRINHYKELARKGIDIISKMEYKTHHIFYQKAVCWFNCWDYSKALDSINIAIKMSSRSNKDVLQPYSEMKNKIQKTLNWNSRKGGKGRRN